MRQLAILLIAAAAAFGQNDIGTNPRLLPGDLAVLDAGEIRKDLNCNVAPAKAVLGFDLKFHSGFNIEIPLRELVGPSNQLSIVFRVVPKNSGQDALYFEQRIRVPAIASDQGAASLDGAFDLGAGSYHVDWIMRDNAGRFCSAFWDVDAIPSAKDHDVTLVLPPNAIRRADQDPFQPEPPVARTPHEPLNIKILMNFAAQQPDSAFLVPADRLALLSILRSLSRSPHISTFSLVVFNLQQQRIFYRRDSAAGIDFPTLGQSLKGMNLGTVDLSQLEKKHPDTDFLSALCRKETSDPNLDGLIFIGPKAMLDTNVPDDDLKQIGGLDYPVFYMNYSANPAAVPWKDSISHIVKFLKGREYTITGPRDLWNAVTEAVSKISKARQVRLHAPTGD